MSVRIPAVANQFYPGSEQMLRQAILDHLSNAREVEFPKDAKAVIVPHAGYPYSGIVAASAFKLLKNLDQKKQWKVLLLGPAHKIPFSGAAVSEYGQWQTPLGMVNVKDIRNELENYKEKEEASTPSTLDREWRPGRGWINIDHAEKPKNENENIVSMPDAELQEHSLEVQVPFLQMCLEDFVIYPLTLGSVRADMLADDLMEFCKADDVIIVVSTDLSHYLEYEKAKEIDFKTCQAIESMDIDAMIEKGDACGRFAVLTLMFIAEKLGWKTKVLDYKNSGDTGGDADGVVGYTAFGFYK